MQKTKASFLVKIKILINLDELKKVAERVIKSNFPQNDSYEHEDWNIKINRNSAFVTSKQISTRANGQKVNAFKAAYLAKIGNDWKIVDNRHNLKTNNTVEQEEEEGIKNMIVSETMAGRERDTEKECSHRNSTPTTSFIGSYDNNAMSVLGFETIKTQVTDYQKKTHTKLPFSPIKNSDYVIKIHGNNAIVTN